MKLLLSPHNDDETLFSYFTLLAHRPHVIVLLRSYIQANRGHDITAAMRMNETRAAMEIAACPVEFWDYRDDRPNWEGIERDLRAYNIDQVTDVWAPKPEPYGNEQHNMIGRIAEMVFGDKCHFYLTYTTAGKSTNGQIVAVAPRWVELKLKALACYRSQINLPSTMPHFLRSQEEYVSVDR